MPLDPAKIQAVLDAKGITRAELSRRTGIAPPHVTRILSGERTDPALSTVERLANALKCPLAKLIHNKGGSR